MKPFVPQRRLTLQGWSLLILLALIWGGSFTANHQALAQWPVASIVAFRVSLAAATLWIHVAISRLPVPAGWRFRRDALVLGLLNNVVPFSLIVWGQSQIASGLAGILNASTALFSVLVAAAVFPDERLGLRRLTGVLTGLAGVALVIGPQALTRLDLTSLGQGAILGAGLSYAVAAAWGRRALEGVRPEVGAAAMLTASSLVMVPAALILDGPPPIPAPPTLAALAYLALIASALAYRLFYTILQMAGAGNLGLVTLLIAPVAVLSGALFFSETLPPAALAGLALLTLGLVVIDGRPLTWIATRLSRPL
ncbi:EamA family transporter [bacterium]|nr:EamA family transporter [bacterium]